MGVWECGGVGVWEYAFKVRVSFLDLIPTAPFTY